MWRFFWWSTCRFSNWFFFCSFFSFFFFLSFFFSFPFPFSPFSFTTAHSSILTLKKLNIKQHFLAAIAGLMIQASEKTISARKLAHFLVDASVLPFGVEGTRNSADRIHHLKVLFIIYLFIHYLFIYLLFIIYFFFI